jgi:hypothetical protein
MTAEWLTAYASAGTLVVILASAFAALIQLRHLRSSNQIAALTEFRERIESPEFRDAEYFVSYELPTHYSDPEKYRDMLTLPFAGNYRSIAIVANLFENLGLFVKFGVIEPTLACDMWNVVVLRNWKALSPMITYVRSEVDGSLWDNFEYFAVLCEDYRGKHSSDYPARTRRMPVDRSLIDAARG